MGPNVAGNASRGGGIGRPQAWQRTVDVAFDVVILGGIVAPPAAGIVAMMSMLLPATAPLRHLTGWVFVCSGSWFVVALLGAHLRMRRHEGETNH
jgi:hypothetical protein